MHPHPSWLEQLMTQPGRRSITGDPSLIIFVDDPQCVTAHKQRNKSATMAPGRWGASLDMYRKVPQDLMEGSRRGKMMSTIALFAIATLFFMETRAFFRTRYVWYSNAVLLCSVIDTYVYAQ